MILKVRTTMPQFLTHLNRILILFYIICILPLAAGFVTGHPVPGAGQTPWGSLIRAEHQNVLAKSKMISLNLHKPEDFKLLYHLSGPEAVESLKRLHYYVIYFQQVAQTLPPVHSADAYAMLGFCYFHQNKFKESYENYTKSLEQDPTFLWTYYNLAVIEFKARNYDKAVFLLDRMFKVSPEISAKIISSSKVYSDVLRDHQGPLVFPRELKATYADAMRMMVISLYQTKKFPELLTTARYAASSGFVPAAVFDHYAALAADTMG